MNVSKKLLVVSSLILASATSHAVLTFQINVDTKQITASGSASGTTDDFWSPNGGVDWTGIFNGITSATAGSLSLSAITSPFYSGGPASISFPNLNISGTNITVGANIDFVDSFSNAGFSALGGSVSYAGLDASQIALIEELGASGFSFTTGGFGSGREPIAFTLLGTPIPEPSTYIAGAGFIAIGAFLVIRRRKAKAAAATSL